MVHLTPINHIWLHIDAEPHILREIYDYFTFDATNAKFMRRQSRYRGWDGKIHLFALKSQRLYRGLVSRVIEFCVQREYPYTSTVPVPIATLQDPAELTEWLSTLDLPFSPRDYQCNALQACLRNHRNIIVSPTGSGKSFIIYLLMLALSVPKLLIVVPTIGLVTQMISDFRSYGWEGDIHGIQAGAPKYTDASIIVATWQSIYDLDPEYFRQFGAVVCDEVHLAKAASLKSLFEKIDCEYRFGFTGTINDTLAHRLILEGLFGEVFQTTSTAALVTRQELAPLHVRMVALHYPQATCQSLRRASYQDEIDFLVGHDARQHFLAQLVAKLKGNVLILFNLIDRHGVDLYQRICRVAPHKQVHFVTGAMDGPAREDVRTHVEHTDNCEQVIVATYGCLSTGVNIRRLHHLIFAAPGKSKIRTLQSIGRGLRTHIHKSKITIWDVVDDLRVGRATNYAFKHAEERSRLYALEKFPVTLHHLNVERFSLVDTPGGEPTLDQGSLGV